MRHLRIGTIEYTVGIIRGAFIVFFMGLMGNGASLRPAVADEAVMAAAAVDPYLWLEQVDSERALNWVRAENAKTQGVLEKDPRYATLYAQALAIAQAKDRIPAPTMLDGAIYNLWQDAEHVHGIWRRTTLESYRSAAPLWTTVLDLDELSRTEHANWFLKDVSCLEPSEQRCLLSLSDGGEDAVTIREFDLRSQRFVQDGFMLPKGKQRAAWENQDAVLVSREWQPGELTASGYPYVVRRLRRGQALRAAREVFRGAASDGGYGVTPTLLRDAIGREAIVIERPLSTFESEYYAMRGAHVLQLGLPRKTTLQTLFDGQLIFSIEQDWNPGAPLQAGSLLALDWQQALRRPQQLEPTVLYVPTERASLAAAAATSNALIVTSFDNVRGRAAVYRRDARGQWSHQAIELPDNATIAIADTNLHSPDALLSVDGFLQPTSLWLLDRDAARPVAIKTLPARFDASGDMVEQFEAKSGDGTQIPYFVVHSRAMKLDGSNPTILYAYGGFQISMTPRYAANIGKLWLERGGVYVLANIRGGGEFGPAWHEMGLKTHRQRIYDDFVAVARDLIARQITSTRRLGIQGGSNGGLLMGVQLTQHPELWNAVDIQVPLLDMLRFEKIAAGTSWVGEYGSVSNPDEAAFLAKISPYANLRRDIHYPEPFIWTTTKDDRVGPQHARKFAARLAEYGNPYLYYEVIEGGHGAGANLEEKAHTNALEITYFSRRLMD